MQSADFLPGNLEARRDFLRAELARTEAMITVASGKGWAH
jgi:hypothetical protein